MFGKLLFILVAIVLPLAGMAWLVAQAIRMLGGQGACFALPLLFVYGVALLLVIEFQKGRSASRRAKRLCERCGYDRSGVPGGVCPECGSSE
ncbi:MAG: hypothetical protein KF684_02875 [Phycisphaeraceae bacterium]|nr:hypothetical protein [Phycisphaeraceae bacterium]